MQANTPPLIHILIAGRTLCGADIVAHLGDHGMRDAKGDRWVSWEARSEATCDPCLSAAFRRIAHADPLPPSSDIDAARERHAEAEAQKLRIAGLFANEGHELLRLLFAWRAQGAISRWSTLPSRKLARLADRIEREYPDAAAPFMVEGGRLALAHALTQHDALRTPKGQLRAISNAQHILRQLVEEMDQVINAVAETAEGDGHDG